ncbi:MAG TPA: head-tail connector protein [Oscillospiraceae bacterium]|nr:head-tail connector protein [Oscillospiraceae bacterium]
MTTTVPDTELAAVKTYCKFDDDEDDDDIIGLILSAKQYLANSGIKEPEEPSLDPQYSLMVKGLTLWYHDKRDEPVAMPVGLRDTINQRKFCGKNAAVLTAST